MQLKKFKAAIILSLTCFMICNAQVAPVISPIGGFNIDGYLERQGAAGDWLSGNPPFDAPGSFVFSSLTGIPSLPHSYVIVDPWDYVGDNVFFKADLNENPNTFKWQFKKAA